MFQITPPRQLLEVGHSRRPTLPLIRFLPEICLSLTWGAHSLFIFIVSILPDAPGDASSIHLAPSISCSASPLLSFSPRCLLPLMAPA